VICAYFSRLTREKNSATWEVLEELTPFRLVAVREGIDSPPGQEPDWNQAIQGFQANSEWKVLAKHLKAGKHESWERGAYVTKNVPAGYGHTTVTTERGKERVGPLQKNEHTEAIAQAFAVRAAGGSWSEVARVLMHAGVPTRTGETRWSTSGAQRLVQNPIYRGSLRCTCGCGESRDIAGLAIVTPSTWNNVNPPTPKGKAKRGRKDHGKHLLSGLLRCAECGYGLTFHLQKAPNGREYRRYRCRSGLRCTSHPFVRAEDVEELLKAAALDMFAQTDPHIGHDANVEVLAGLEHERDQARERLAGLVRLIDPLDPGAEERLARAREEVATAEAALLVEQSAQMDHLSEAEVREMFQRSPVEEQRQLLRMMLQGATVRAGKDPVSDRVEVFPNLVVFAPRAAR
jgi:hypothetical protein